MLKNQLHGDQEQISAHQSAGISSGRDLKRRTREGVKCAEGHQKYREKQVAWPYLPRALAGSITPGQWLTLLCLSFLHCELGIITVHVSEVLAALGLNG